MKTTTLSVKPAEEGTPLIDFLARRLDLSKKKAKTLLDRRAVFVNRRRVWMARHALRAGDSVECATSGDPRPAPDRPIVLLHRDDDIVVANKPAGLPAVGPGGLEERLRAQCGAPQLRAVHRLDRDTTGCLALAAHADAFDRMVGLFRDGRVAKTYHAIAAGRMPAGRGTISETIDGKRAISHFRTLDGNAQATHLLIRTETGRTHQIRKHLQHQRHPLLGDRQYAAGAPLDDKALKVPRQMLHAGELAFPHPVGGTPVRVRAPLPPDFRHCLRIFRLR